MVILHVIDDVKKDIEAIFNSEAESIATTYRYSDWFHHNSILRSHAQFYGTLGAYALHCSFTIPSCFLFDPLTRSRSPPIIMKDQTSLILKRGNHDHPSLYRSIKRMGAEFMCTGVQIAPLFHTPCYTLRNRYINR